MSAAIEPLPVAESHVSTSTSSYTNTASPAPTTFASLPAELRLAIWRLALPRGRVIEVHARADQSGFFTETAVPAVLHANRESRCEALRFFSLLNIENPLTPARPFSAYIDYASDGVYLHRRLSFHSGLRSVDILNFLADSDANKCLQRLLVNPTFFLAQTEADRVAAGWGLSTGLVFKSNFLKLQELIIVEQEHDDEGRWYQYDDVAIGHTEAVGFSGSLGSSPSDPSWDLPEMHYDTLEARWHRRMLEYVRADNLSEAVELKQSLLNGLIYVHESIAYVPFAVEGRAQVLPGSVTRKT